jgi:hypothetical protein
MAKLVQAAYVIAGQPTELAPRCGRRWSSDNTTITATEIVRARMLMLVTR